MEPVGGKSKFISAQINADNLDFTLPKLIYELEQLFEKTKKGAVLEFRGCSFEYGDDVYSNHLTYYVDFEYHLKEKVNDGTK